MNMSMDHTSAAGRARGTAAVRTALAVALSLALGACATSSPVFDTPDTGFKGRISVVDTPLVVAGTDVKLAGRDFKPGQEVKLSYGGVALGAPVVVGADGTFRTQIALPANTPAGLHPVVVNAARPAAALVYPLKVSPTLPLSGEQNYTLTSQKLVQGLYQSAYSAKTDRLFVTAAVGRPPVSQSELVKVNAKTLAIESRVTPAVAPAPAVRAPRPGQPAAAATAGAPAAPRAPAVYAVYGVGVDDTNGSVWVTNTRQDTVAVYRQSDLQLLKQFAPGVVPHARDVVVDEALGKVYVSANGKPQIAVFDAKSLQFLKNIPINTGGDVSDKEFAPMSLELDRVNHKLYTVSIGTDEAAVIDTRTDATEKVFTIEGSKSAAGVGFDARTNRLLVASQGTDNLLIVDAASGKTLHDVKVGSGPLNVAIDHARGLAYVPNRGSGTVTVVSLDGKIVANLPGGTLPNHVADDGKGSIYAINKGRGAEDPLGDRITRIVRR